MSSARSGDARKRALMVFAHADDETLLAGALIAKLVGDGWRVDLLCVAPGDDDDRCARMELAAAELGIETVSSLRFSSAVAAMSPGARVSPALLSAPEDVVVSQVEGRIAELMPSMIITHSPSGDYGHPDHALCHRLTARAAASAAPQAAVYALAWPKKVLWLNALVERVMGVVTLRKLRNSDAGPVAALTGKSGGDASPVRPANLSVTTTHDVHRYLATRKRAARHYKQELAVGPLPLRLLEAAPIPLQRLVLGKSHLSRLR